PLQHILPASEALWGGMLNDLTLTKLLPDSSTPPTLWIFVVSRASSNVNGGRIVGTLLASMVLPDPGGPIIKMLWPPAQATSSARLAVYCPRTSLKSTLNCCDSCSSASQSTLSGLTPLPEFTSATSMKERTG